MSWGWSALLRLALVTVLVLRAVFLGLLRFLGVWQGGSVAILSAPSSVLLSLRWLGLRDHAALVGDGGAAPLQGGITGLPSPTLVCSWLGLRSDGLSVHSGAARSVGVATPLVCVYGCLTSMGSPHVVLFIKCLPTHLECSTALFPDPRAWAVDALRPSWWLLCGLN